MNILILCDYFEPVSMIGAVRPTEFAKCFKKMGHTVDVITLFDSSWPIDDSVSSNFNVKTIHIQNDKCFRKYRQIEKIRQILLRKKSNNKANCLNAEVDSYNVKKGNKRIRILSYFRAFYSTKSKIIFGKCGAKGIYKIWKNQNTTYDVVYSTYGGFSSVLAGEKIKNKSNVKWIVDFRDAVYYKMFVKANVKYFKYFLVNHCSKCDSLVFASQGYKADSILPMKFNGNISIIENGFMEFRGYERKPNNKLILLYCGSMYGDRHLKSIFSAIKKMEAEIGSLKLIIQFCGNRESFDIFEAEAKQYNIEKYLSYRGYLKSNELFIVENKADAFLISSWNYADYSGVLPGKLFEYMSFKKPIIGHVSGDFPNSEIKAMINENGLGYCADDVATGDFKKMHNYLLSMYNNFIEFGRIHYYGKIEFIDCYKRDKQAAKLLSTLTKFKNE